jgi:methylated-DNA-[protein]-cysteine S-methyltransferase
MEPGGHHRRATTRNARDRHARRLYQLYPDVRQLTPPANTQAAIDGITALLRGAACDFADMTLDMAGIPGFNQRVYAYVRTIPRGETRTYAEVAVGIRASGAVRSVAQAIGRNPFMIIVPCHRVLEAGNYADKISANGGAISNRRLLSVEGTSRMPGKTLFDGRLPVAPPRPHP